MHIWRNKKNGGEVNPQAHADSHLTGGLKRIVYKLIRSACVLEKTTIGSEADVVFEENLPLIGCGTQRRKRKAVAATPPAEY